MRAPAVARLGAVLALLVALVLGASACGGGGGSESTTAASTATGSPVAQAAEETQSAGSAKLSFDASVAIPGKSQPTELTGDGAFDFANQQGTLTFDLSSLSSQLGALGLAGGSKITILLDGQTLYVDVPFLGQLLGGKEWIKVDLADLAKQQGLNLGQLSQVAQADPTQFLTYLQAAGDVQEVGKEQVRGVDTTHYKVTIDLAKLAANATGEQKQALEQLIQSGQTSVPVDVWIDGDSLLRRMRVDVPAAQGTTGSGSVTLELYDYGTDVNVQVPPADQVTDFSQLAGLMGSLGTSSTSGTATATTP